MRIQDTCSLPPNAVNCVQILVQLQLDYCGAYSGTACFRVNRVYILYTEIIIFFLTKRGTLCDILKYLKHTLESITCINVF